ncbi:MAG: NAD(P)-binding domain-containing protein [Verrucomicrobiae bacterium]|nr:NAD(P)-binding domain-containing protein [Verrucomicrobiae bacterium]
MSQSRRIAIIGAGAAGLVSARECLRQGLESVVYEASDRVGGVWNYTDKVEDDLLGLNPSRPLHGSLYKNLRTNLPRKLMAFRDFLFEPEGVEAQFVGHEVVLQYLKDFSGHFDLYPAIEFNAQVELVSPLPRGKWQLRVNGQKSEFDGVMVCNGHYSKPRIPSISGMESFPGILLHSHNYRTPETFSGKRVALFGAAASALDLSLEINQVADQVFWCAEEHAEIDVDQEIIRCPAPKRFEANGLILKGASRIDRLDAFIFCTGYHYHFPFLDSDLVKVADNWVHPLYQELVPPLHPTIAFVGLPYAVIPFPLFEIQAKWFTRMLADCFKLPSGSVMEAWCLEKAAWLKANKAKQRNFHKKGVEQYAYMNALAEECGADPLPDWFEPLAQAIRNARLEDPVNYRDKLRINP